MRLGGQDSLVKQYTNLKEKQREEEENMSKSIIGEKSISGGKAIKSFNKGGLIKVSLQVKCG